MAIATVTLNGRLGKEPEMRYTQSGQALLTFSVAVSQYRSGQESTGWYDVSVFGKPAESLQTRLAKGARVVVTGQQTIEEFERRDGGRGKAIRVNANSVDVLDKVERVAAPVEAGATASDDTDDLPF